jgi:hypothetical protein
LVSNELNAAVPVPLVPIAVKYVPFDTFKYVSALAPALSFLTNKLVDAF